MSSKTARLHRRQAANRRKYARLRKSGRVPQHTEAERKRAAAEREADRRRAIWLRRATLPVVTGVGAAATIVTVSAAPATGGIMHLYHPYSAASQPYPYVSPAPDDPDPPHVPEPDMTFYTAYDGSGTSTATTRIGPGTWNPWEWTYGSNVPGD